MLTQINLVVAEHEHLCEHHPTGADFGSHLAEHTRQGHFSGNMNPGIHQGYSPCVPD